MAALDLVKNSKAGEVVSRKVQRCLVWPGLDKQINAGTAKWSYTW